MKTKYYTNLFLFLAYFSYSFTALCPDPPINDDPCILSDNPPLDLTVIGTHEGTTCCARGPQDLNNDGSPADFGNLVCSDSTENAAVWYRYTPDPMDVGYSILLEESMTDSVEGPISIEVYWGDEDQGCNGFLEAVAFSCSETTARIDIKGCTQTGEVLFIKISTNNSENACGSFIISVISNHNDNGANSCTDLENLIPIELMIPALFTDDYVCLSGNLGYACPEDDNLGGCEAFTEMPTVWYHFKSKDNAAQMFTTVEPNGDWDPVWSVFSGHDCDNLTVIEAGGSPPCSNGDNTVELHQTSIFDDEEDYWVMVSVDPNSIPASGIDDFSFELCVATTISAIICLGELEGGKCDDESLIMEIIEREHEDQSLDGPFCQGEEVTVLVSFFYDASESGADWLSGFIPVFGRGWDVENFDFEAYPPTGLGKTAKWYEEGSDLAPIIQEDVPILCTYRDEYGRLQICNWLCYPCTECEETGMIEGDPLPSGYFWVSNGGNAGCDNDGSPGEGWGIGSVRAQIDWYFKIRVKTFDTAEECLDTDDLRINFQTFSDGVAGCWEDPVGECLLDRMMVSSLWKVRCSELPPDVMSENQEICSDELTDVAVSVESENVISIVVNSIDNPYIEGSSDYFFEEGAGIISDQLINLSGIDQIQQYELYSIDTLFDCYGAKSIVGVLVKAGKIDSLPEVICSCIDGCTSIGIDSIIGNTYLWSTGETTSTIEVCPDTTTTYIITITDSSGCINLGSTKVDCNGLIEECQEPEYYKLVYDFFIDQNEDGIRDADDISFGGGSFLLEPLGIIVNNITIGEDTLLLMEGDYSLIYQSGGYEDWTLTTDSIFLVQLDSTINCVKVEFGLTTNTLARNIQLSHHVNNQCNSTSVFTLVAENTGTQVEEGYLVLEYDEAISFNAGTSTDVDTIFAPRKIGWYFSDLAPGEKVVGTVAFLIPGLPEFAIGGELNHTIYAQVLNLDSTYTILGEEDISGIVYCGYESNDKLVEPYHESGYTDIIQEELLYKIRFQNKGNEMASNLEIRDVISEFLDASTVNYVGGSHDDFLTFSSVEGNTIIFDFEGINLPPSNDDLNESQGFVMFRVALKNGLTEGTVIENQAEIRFDNRAEIETNITQNILGIDLDGDGYFSNEDCDDEDAEINPGVEEIPNNEIDEDCDGEALIIDVDMDGFNSDEDCDDEDADINPDAFDIPDNGIDEDCDGMDDTLINVNELGQNDVRIYPNPSNDAFIITFRENTSVQYSISDVMGREIERGNINGMKSTIHLGDKLDGLYLLIIKYKRQSLKSYHKLLKI